MRIGLTANQNYDPARYNLKKGSKLMNQTISNLRSQVQAAFQEDDDLQDFGIEILDSNGVITLRGTVPTTAARERAESIARQVDGVTSVINEIDMISY
jgi:osmotically-inducible protein OsmY